MEYGPAKRKAARDLGRHGGRRGELPSNEAVEDEVREYLSLFCADTQPAELLALRELAVHVTRAVYSTRDIDEQAATRCELLSSEIDSVCRDRTPTSVRLRALVDPRLMRRRFAN